MTLRLMRVAPVVALFLSSVPALAQTSAAPPPPVAPATSNRDPATGLVTVRATRTPIPIKVDGQLDEPVYTDVAPMSGFIQTEPTDGKVAEERTEIWLLFDKDNIYITARCWETHPERVVANEMRRDANPVYTSTDNVAFMLDTSNDERNGIVLVVNSIGGRNDGQFTDGRVSLDWNPVWNFKTSAFDGGWIVETAIPFRSIRYNQGDGQTWGFNAVRLSRWRNEISYLNRVPVGKGQGAIIQANLAAKAVGIDVPPPGKNLEIKPYIIGSLTTDRINAPRTSNDPDGNAGVDAKYGVTQNLTADFTYNTDFAQVEADEQQVNLTRFNLFFPEKREFFLENQTTFAFGGVAVPSAGNQVVIGDAPVMFYSRRIGLNGATVVPIVGGGRLTGRAGAFTVGMLNIQSAEDTASRSASTNFTVVRVKRDVLKRSSLGMVYTGRSIAQNRVGRNDLYGADAIFGFFANLSASAYWAKSSTEGRRGDDTSYRANIDYSADRYAVQAEHLGIGRNFNPEIGFTRRLDTFKTYALARFSPRPKNARLIRKFTYQASVTHIENGQGRVDLRNQEGFFSTAFQNGDTASASWNNSAEFIPLPFAIYPGFTIPIGTHDYRFGRVSYAFGQQRRVFGTVALEKGSIYGGTRTTYSVSGGRVGVTPMLSVEPSMSINRVELPAGSFTNRVLGSRMTYTMTPRMFVSALVQYTSAAASLGSNIRLRWEYSPGSELFVVFNDQRDTRVGGFPELQVRSFVVKVNRFVRF